jgi:hypothetical protein
VSIFGNWAINEGIVSNPPATAKLYPKHMYAGSTTSKMVAIFSRWPLKPMNRAIVTFPPRDESVIRLKTARGNIEREERNKGDSRPDITSRFGVLVTSFPPLAFFS